MTLLIDVLSLLYLLILILIAVAILLLWIYAFFSCFGSSAQETGIQSLSDSQTRSAHCQSALVHQVSHPVPGIAGSGRSLAARGVNSRAGKSANTGNKGSATVTPLNLNCFFSCSNSLLLIRPKPDPVF